MNAADVMTTGAATVRPETPLVEAAQLMIQHRISGLPVVDASEKLVGVISEGDFLRRTSGDKPRLLELLIGEKVDFAGHRVEEYMSRDPVTIAVDTPVEEIVALMNRHKVRRLPVAAQGKVVGIVSRANLIEALVRRSQAGAKRRP